MSKNFMLKVRAKTLADEARHLKLAKRKTERSAERVLKFAGRYTDNVAGMMKDRYKQLGDIDKERNQVRLEARAVNLARGYLKGLPYLVVENTTRITTSEMMDLSNLVMDYVYLYGELDDLADIDEWLGLVEPEGVDDDERTFYDSMKRVIGF